MKQPNPETRAPGLRACLSTSAIAALAWWVLLGDEPMSWIVGAPCVLICAWLANGMRPAQRLRVSLSGWLRLVPYFLWCSFAGGWDVARRVLAPSLAVNPGFVEFTLKVPAGPARTFYIQFIGLLPGTLGAWLEDDRLKVHVLNLDADQGRALRAAEERVAAAFAVRTAT